MPKVALPLWAKAAAVLALLLSLVLLLSAVVEGTRGEIEISNDLAALSLLSMALFAGVSLSQERALARRTAASTVPAPTGEGRSSDRP